jgi:hypothetical protein
MQHTCAAAPSLPPYLAKSEVPQPGTKNVPRLTTTPTHLSSRSTLVVSPYTDPPGVPHKDTHTCPCTRSQIRHGPSLDTHAPTQNMLEGGGAQNTTPPSQVKREAAHKSINQRSTRRVLLLQKARTYQAPCHNCTVLCEGPGRVRHNSMHVTQALNHAGVKDLWAGRRDTRRETEEEG